MAAVEGRPMYVALDWIERHCIVPDGFRAGQPFTLYEYQGAYIKAFYTVRSDAPWDPVNPVKASAFVYRRALLVGPQKVGKNPMIAAQICLEGVGPALFAGYAGTDEGYVCADHGCRCGWEYAYDPGEPMGMAWPTPLVQVTAYSEESTDNTYDALKPMIDNGPLADLIPKTGEEFIRLPGGGRIDVVTSSAQSRLGQRLTFAPQDELGIWTPRSGMTKVADTQYRGLAGMGGRASCTSNAWDPAEHSVAQVMYESEATDIWRQFKLPPANLSYGNKRERHKIHQSVYPTETWRQNGGHVDLDSIEAEAADLITRDEPQAERFFGNRLVKGSGRAFDLAHFKTLAVKNAKVVPDRALITVGFDGSRLWDATALIGTEVASGYQWPIAVWQRPPERKVWEVPAKEVDAAVRMAFATWDVWGLYADPPYWESNVAFWASEFGEERVKEWRTGRPKAMAEGIRAWNEAMRSGEMSHCAESDRLCGVFTTHVGNATRKETGYKDDFGLLWIVEKDATNSPDKIDCVPAAVLSWEARNDAIASGALNTEISAYEGMTEEQIVAMLLGGSPDTADETEEVTA